MARGITSRRQFMWFFSSYLMIMLAGLILVNALFFGEAMRKSRERAIQAQTNDAYALKEQIDEQLERITRVYSRMCDLHWVVKMSIDKPGAQVEFDSVNRLHIINELRTYTTNEAFAGQTMLIFPGQNTIVSSSGWMPIDDYLRLIGTDEEHTRLIDAIDSTYNFEAISPNKLMINQRPYIWLMYTPKKLAKPGLQFVFLIDKIIMTDMLKGMFAGDICAVNIFDGYGRQLNSAGASGRAERELVLDAQCFGWKYHIALLAPEIMLAPSDFLFMLISLALFALVGPFLAYYLARVSYKPLDRLMAKVSPEAAPQEGAGEYARLESYIDRIATDNKQMAQKLEDYQESAEQDVLMRLLHGYFDLESIDKLHWFGFPYTEETAFAVMVVAPARTQSKFERDQQLKLALSVSVYMEEALKEHSFDWRVYPFYEEATVVVLSDNDGRLSDNAVNALADGFLESVAGGGARLDVFCGHTQLGILGISISYQQAKELINARLFAAPDSAPGKQLQTAPRFYYPTDWEIQLINNLKIANYEAAERILNEIQSENDKQGLSPTAREALLRAVGETIRRVATELNLTSTAESDNARAIWDSQSGQGDWLWLFDACRAICERTAYSHSESTEISGRMVEYVTQNYADAEISLKKLTELFGLSASTISNIFKLNAGMNFYDFLCRLRMERAKALLRDTDDLVRDIGRAVGYENEHSFRRAFQRYEGVAPADFRKSASP